MQSNGLTLERLLMPDPPPLTAFSAEQQTLNSKLFYIMQLQICIKAYFPNLLGLILILETLIHKICGRL